ncbi:MAG: rhomboid family intramembrane serine protease, partial [Solirubrobacterales bacterium]
RIRAIPVADAHRYDAAGMAERELFVICNNCGSEVSPYVTECPYCGHRLRKRAPDLKKARKDEEKAERRAEKQAAKERSRTKRILTGGGGGGSGTPSYLQTSRPPIAISLLVVASVVLSLAARVDQFPAEDLYFSGGVTENWWQLFSAPFLHFGFGYGFVALVGAALFGAGLERRFGPITLVATWMLCGATGVLMEDLIATAPFTSGAIGIAVGFMAAWLIYVLTREDLRDHDSYGLIAVSVVLLAMPIATDEASIWTIVGGLIAGAVSGLMLMQFRAADSE